jgi:hypothetical protein
METWRLESRALLNRIDVLLICLCRQCCCACAVAFLLGIFISSAYICLLCCLLLPVAVWHCGLCGCEIVSLKLCCAVLTCDL